MSQKIEIQFDDYSVLTTSTGPKVMVHLTVDDLVTPQDIIILSKDTIARRFRSKLKRIQKTNPDLYGSIVAKGEWRMSMSDLIGKTGHGGVLVTDPSVLAGALNAEQIIETARLAGIDLAAVAASQTS